MATHSSMLACRIPTDRGAWWATVHGIANVVCDRVTKHIVKLLVLVQEIRASLQNPHKLIQVSLHLLFSWQKQRDGAFFSLCCCVNIM